MATKFTRGDLWLEEFGHVADAQEPETRDLILDGSIEVCPLCGEMSAYAWSDCDDYEQYDPQSGQIAHIGTSSGMGEWQCGHCRTYLVDVDSPINHPCYTHS